MLKKKSSFKQFFTVLLCAVLSAAILASCSIDLSSLFEEPKTQYEGKLAMHVLDVGQGDSIFIELPNGETMLIDAAENYYGEGIIEYIQNAGHKQIDYLIATHPHTDHIGSMAYIVRNFDVKSVYMPKVAANTKTYENLLQAIKKKNLTIKNGKAGVNILKTDSLSADIIAPVKIDNGNMNNCSIVLKLTFGNRAFLLTGDAETGEMDTITADMHADVLKVGHHGSSTSTSKRILSQIKPQIAVISCGRYNDYGHPHKEVLNSLKKANCTVYRTDKNNTVVVSSDGIKLNVETDKESIVRDGH